jgi:hypothetical protein
LHLPYTRLLRGKIQGLRRRFKRIASVHKPPGEPVSRLFGLDRGSSIDRYWIEAFLARHASNATGSALEVGGTDYISRFFPRQGPHHLELAHDGTPNCVECNLEAGPPASAGAFDTFVATQVFNFIYETRVGLRSATALLKPDGVMLGSVAGITQVSRHDADRWGHFYSFTAQSWERLLREAFDEVDVEAFGNVDSACAFLNGLCAEEVDRAVLDHHDPDYPALLCFRATRPRRGS